MLILFLSLVIVAPNPYGIDMINNVYADYFTTIYYVNIYGYEIEANPFAREYIFKGNNYKTMKAYGFVYLIFLTSLKATTGKYFPVVAYLIEGGHFIGALTWGEYLKYPVVFRITKRF